MKTTRKKARRVLDIQKWPGIVYGYHGAGWNDALGIVRGRPVILKNGNVRECSISEALHWLATYLPQGDKYEWELYYDEPRLGEFAALTLQYLTAAKS